MGFELENGLVRAADVLLGYWRVGGGCEDVPLSTSLQVVALVVPTVAVILATVFLWTSARRRQSQVDGPPAPTAAPLDPHGLDSLLQSMSGRVAAVEGRLGAVAAELQGVAILQQRLAAVEASMPSVQEAYEKYGDQVARADKRATERHRVEEKTSGFQTAGDAAALIGAAGNGGEPALTHPAAPQNGRPAFTGVVGSGGRGKNFGARE